jgi:hypothetical protein
MNYVLSCTGTCLELFIVHFEAHVNIFFPAFEINKLNLIALREIPTYVKFDLCEVPWNATLM